MELGLGSGLGQGVGLCMAWLRLASLMKLTEDNTVEIFVEMIAS